MGAAPRIRWCEPLWLYRRRLEAWSRESAARCVREFDEVIDGMWWSREGRCEGA